MNNGRKTIIIEYSTSIEDEVLQLLWKELRPFKIAGQLRIVEEKT
jgi:hypothetical protein